MCGGGSGLGWVGLENCSKLNANWDCTVSSIPVWCTEWDPVKTEQISQQCSVFTLQHHSWFCSLSYLRAADHFYGQITKVFTIAAPVCYWLVKSWWAGTSEETRAVLHSAVTSAWQGKELYSWKILTCSSHFINIVFHFHENILSVELPRWTHIIGKCVYCGLKTYEFSIYMGVYSGSILKCSFTGAYFKVLRTH